MEEAGVEEIMEEELVEDEPVEEQEEAFGEEEEAAAAAEEEEAVEEDEFAEEAAEEEDEAVLPGISEAELAALEKEACEAWAFTPPPDAPKPAAAPGKAAQGKLAAPAPKPGQRPPTPWHAQSSTKPASPTAAPRLAGPPGKALQPTSPAGQKRPAAADEEGMDVKRPKANVPMEPARGARPGQPQAGVAKASADAKAAGGAAAAPANKVRLHAEVANKLKLLSAEGIKFAHAAVFAIAQTEKAKVLAVLQALTKEDPAPKDPSQWVLAKLEVKDNPAKAPPAGKAPVAKGPVRQVVAKAAVGSQAKRLPPKERHDLDFEQLAVQAKLLALNKQGIWKIPHPLDEAALSALLGVDAGRSHEILDEVEEKGIAGTLLDPSAFIRRAIALEQQRLAF